HICYLRNFWTVEDEIWINFSLTDPISYPTACLAIGTLATAYYGKRNRQPEIVVCAIRNYGRALVALQRALLQSDNSCTFDILAASTALQRYEVIISTTSTGWIQHSGGVARAIELSGPECFTRNPNKAILDANSYRIIQEAYHHRRRTFLALEKWRNLRTNLDDQSVHFDRLQDLYARLPGLAEGVTSFLADQGSGRHRKILDEANRLLADLETWVNHWIAEFNFRPVERFTSSTRSIYNDAKGPAFRSFLHYPSPLAGIGANIYRAIKLTTLEWRHKLQHPSWWAGEDHERMDEVPSIHQLAMDSCRTLNSHFSDGSGQEVCQVWYLLFCSLTAYKALYRRSREARWISAMLRNVGDRFGLELARNLTLPMQLGHERVVGAEHISHGKTSQAVISTFILLVRGAAQKFVTYLFG
ncbi:hypothetical protein MMC08_008981, partial [Hypocenomyce scalaris]|nr:hypothetical protein [Hypocenomyce scalaris]